MSTTVHEAEAAVTAGPEAPQPRPLHERKVVVRSAQLGIVVIVLAVWEICAATELIDPFFIGQPSKIFGVLVDWVKDGSLFVNLGVTVEEATIGFFVSAIIGIGLGLLFARNPLLDRITYPFIDMFNALPRMALAPLFALWFGLGITGKVVLVFSVAVFNFLINTYSGAKSVDPEYVKMVRLLGATNRELTRKVIIPSIVPWVIAAMRFAVAYSLAAAVIAEIVAAQHGLGYLLAYTSGVLDTNGQFAALVVLVLVAWIANIGISRLARHLLRWQETDDRVL